MVILDVFPGFVAVHYAAFLTGCVIVAVILSQHEIINKQKEKL